MRMKQPCPVEKIRDFTGFCDGLEILRNASDYAYEKPIVEVPSSKRSKTSKETLSESTVDRLNDDDSDPLSNTFVVTLDSESTENSDNGHTDEATTVLDGSPPAKQKQKKTQPK
jgi:hypothetical protein